MSNFDKWDKEFRAQNLYAFNHNENGLLWLKVRAVCRGKQIKRFVTDNHLTLQSTKLADQNIELFQLLESLPNGMEMLDQYLYDRNNEWYTQMGVDEAQLKNDLYNVKYYIWGGDQDNSLDQYLVRRYVKVISKYDELVARRDEIAGNAWNFVQTSWYNNWTSFLIESIFKKHKRVLSAIGEIKSVDFFIDNYPVDLKVTYFPNEFMDNKLKEKLGHSEITWIKQQAKTIGIEVDKTLSDSQKLYILKEKINEVGHSDILDYLNHIRKEIIAETLQDTEQLIRWLYENQSPRLFGAENRLFVILVDTNEMADSWKMKRAFTMIEPKVNHYLDNFTNDTLKPIKFTFNKNNYKSLSDIIFVIKE
jgi:hypothetical protein